MDAKPDDDSLEQFSNLSNDIDRAESLMGQDFIRDLLRLLTVHENGMTERDLAEALISTKSERIPGRAQLDLLRLWIRCAQTLLSSWMTSAYDSGKLLYRLPKKYHAPVVNRYAGRGGASSPSGEMADYQTAVLETYAKPVLDQQVSSKAPTRDGLSVLFTFRLLAFTRCLSVCTLSAAQKRDLFVDTLYNFSWLSSYVHYLSTGAVVRIIWPLRDREEQIQTLCTILELQSAEETDAAIVASGILACLDKNTTGPELVRLYDTTKDWLLDRGISLIPCRPTVAMPRTKHPSVPGPASVIHVFDDETVLTWGVDHGLQVWDLEGVTCLRQMSRRTRWPVHDVIINGATRVAYFTEETYLIGWNAADGARTMELDLLPHVSWTGRKFSPQKDVVPFLSVVDVSENGRLVAVRINHREMLTNDKGIIVVSTEEDGGKIVGAVGDGLFGRNVTNVAFTNDGTMLTITRKLSTTANDPGIVFVKTDPSAGDLFTETRASQGTKDNDISTSDEKTEMRAADDQTTGGSESNDSREDEQKTDPRNDDASSDARLETRPTNSETYSSEKKQDDGTAEEGHWSDIGQSTDKGAIGVIEESEINEERHDVSDKADTTETPSSDPDVTAVSPEGSGGERCKNDSNDGASSERKEPIRRQEALDAADEEASLRADEVVEAPLDEAGSEPSPIRYDFVGGVMARCPDDYSLCVGYSPNGVAKAVPADGILRPYAELSETGSFKIVSVACLGDGRAISAHSQGLGTSPLMLCLWSPEPSRFYVEHRGLFRFVKPADGDHSVMVAYHNKVAIMDVDSRTCTHVFDFPANEITSAILRNGVLYAGTGSSVVTREVSRYAVSPPYDVVASRSDSVTFEDDEQLEAIHVTTIPVEDLPLAMTSYGPSGVSRLVLLPGGDQMAIDVAGALKLMDVADGSLREIGQEVRMLLVDLFIAGSKANSLIALENDSISTGINVLKWELDSLASPPKVVKSQIVQTKWRLSSKKTWLLSLNKRDNSEYADIYVTTLDDLVNDYNRHYVVKESGKNVNFAVSDSGRYMATWQNKGDTITVWDMATGRRVPSEVETDRTTRQDWDERENAQTERRDSASDAQNGGDADVMEQEKESDEPEVVSDGDSIEHTGAATDTKQNVDEDSVKQDSIRDGSEIGDKRADLEQENETTAQTQENGTGRQGQENETDNEGRENETDSQGQENVNENEGRENETGNQGQENETGSQGQENETDSQGQENETGSQGQENETGSQGQENETRNQEQEKETENQGQVNETDNLEHENTTENVKEEITGDEDDRMLGRQSRKLTDNDDHVILGKIEIPVSARSEAVLIVDDQLVIGSKNGYIYQIDIDRLFGIGDDREALAALLMDNRTVLIKDPARSLSLTADGTTLVIVGIKGYVTLLNMSNPTEQVVFDSCQSKVSNAALSVDHSLLLTSGAEGTITLWDALTGKALCTAPTQATIHWLGFVQRDSSVLAWVEKYKGKRSRLIKFDLNR